MPGETVCYWKNSALRPQTDRIDFAGLIRYRIRAFFLRTFFSDSSMVERAAVNR